MSQTQTNSLVDGVGWFSGGGAATQNLVEDMVGAEHSTAFQERWPRRPRRITFVTTTGEYAFLAGGEPAPGPSVPGPATLRDAIPGAPLCPLGQSVLPESDEGLPVFGFPPISRVTIRAVVHVKSGQFALILPDSLMEDED